MHTSNVFRGGEFVAASGGYDEWFGTTFAIDVDSRCVVESGLGDADDGCGFAERLKQPGTKTWSARIIQPDISINDNR
jgi:hypothetical protein